MAHSSGHGNEGCKGRVVWDESTKLDPLDVAVNDYTPTENEPEVAFGTAKKSFYWLIYT